MAFVSQSDLAIRNEIRRVLAEIWDRRRAASKAAHVGSSSSAREEMMMRFNYSYLQRKQTGETVGRLEFSVDTKALGELSGRFPHMKSSDLILEYLRRNLASSGSVRIGVART